MIVAFRVCYYLVVIVAAAAGRANTLQLRGQGQRLEAVERVRDRIRDRIMRADETTADGTDGTDQTAKISALEGRLNELEKLLEKEVALLYLETAKSKEVRP